MNLSFLASIAKLFRKEKKPVSVVTAGVDTAQDQITVTITECTRLDQVRTRARLLANSPTSPKQLAGLQEHFDYPSPRPRFTEGGFVKAATPDEEKLLGFTDHVLGVPYRVTEQLDHLHRYEDAYLHSEIFSMHATHLVALKQEEEKGYARGLLDAVTPAHVKVINDLIAATRASFFLLDNSEEREGDDGLELAVSRIDFDALDSAIDMIDELPDDQPGVFMGPAGKAEWALRDLLIGPALSISHPLPVYLTTQAACDVIAERQRHIDVKGWTHGHDDEHDDGVLASAASAYALAAADALHPFSQGDGAYDRTPPSMWPVDWEVSWWKPSTPRRSLVKAAALILAEIERLDRAALVEAAARSAS